MIRYSFDYIQFTSKSDEFLYKITRIFIFEKSNAFRFSLQYRKLFVLKLLQSKKLNFFVFTKKQGDELLSVASLSPPGQLFDDSSKVPLRTTTRTTINVVRRGIRFTTGCPKIATIYTKRQ